MSVWSWPANPPSLVGGSDDTSPLLVDLASAVDVAIAPGRCGCRCGRQCACSWRGAPPCTMCSRKTSATRECWIFFFFLLFSSLFVPYVVAIRCQLVILKKSNLHKKKKSDLDAWLAFTFLPFTGSNRVNELLPGPHKVCDLPGPVAVSPATRHQPPRPPHVAVTGDIWLGGAKASRP